MGKKGAEAGENVGDEDEGDEREDMENEEEPVHAMGKSGADLPRLSLDNFQWDFGGSSLGVEKEPISNEALNLDSDEDDDDDDDNNADVAQEEAKTTKDEPATKKEKKKQNAKEKKGGNKGRHVQMMEEESVIAAKEKHLLSDSTPTTADDFERLVIASPDSSIVWIHYMSFRLQEAEVEKARAVAQRALDTINFREEGEKMNVWVALLNLEMNYGTEEQLLETFSRASRENDELGIKRHMAVIYASAGKHELAEKNVLGLDQEIPRRAASLVRAFRTLFRPTKEGTRTSVDGARSSVSAFQISYSYSNQ